MAESDMLAKGLRVLSALGERPRGAGVTELADGLDLPFSTVHRLLKTLVTTGFADRQDPGHRYLLGTRTFELSHQFALASGFSAIARPLMERLSEHTGEVSLIAARQGTEMIYLERVEGRRRLQVFGHIGQRGALHATSMGKVLVAFLPEPQRSELVQALTLEGYTPDTITAPGRLLAQLDLVAERGWATNEAEHEEGIVSIAVPVTGARGVVAGLCLTGPSVGIGVADLLEHREVLQHTAKEIGLRLPYGSDV